MKKMWFLVIACMGFLCMLSGCKRSDEEMITKDGFYFDTYIAIRVNKEGGEGLIEQCFSICEEIEETFSRTLETSELYAINHRTDSQVEVSSEMAFLISEGMRYYDLSQGAFDITIAPMLELWDFKSENPSVPDAQAITDNVAKVDASKIHIDGNILSFDSPDTQIDLGALVKGYAADRLKEYLEEQGVTSGMIDLGGNILAIGKNSDNSLWNIGIQKPFADRNETITVVKVDGKSVVSSGVYERCFEQDGIRYYHILDPNTGYPVKTDLWQATIISDNSLEGDALSTLCMLLGREKAETLIGSIDGVEVKFVLNDGRLLE